MPLMATGLLDARLSLSNQTSSLFGVRATIVAAWAGASVHEVGQVILAASPAGAAVVAIAVVVKFTRILMLAPVVALLGAAMLAIAAVQFRRTD